MQAKDLAGIAGFVFVTASAVAIFAELIDDAGATVQTLRLAAYGVAAALLLAAYVVHRRERRPGAEGPGLTAAQALPGQRRARHGARSR